MSTATAGKVLIIPKGEYNSATQYKVLDCVIYNGKTYCAKQTTTGNAPIANPSAQNPDAYWQLFVDNPVDPFTGATALAAGAKGLVPVPSAGDQDKVLHGDGTWKNTMIQNIPTQSGKLSYNGASQSPTWLYYSPNILTLGGTTSATNAGTYTATFTPKSGFCWDDGTTTAQSVTWTIVQADGYALFPPGDKEVTASQPVWSFVVTDETGALSVFSSDTSIATVALTGTSGHRVDITGVSTGTCTISLNVAASADGNYAAKTYIINVIADMRPALVSWATGTDAQIKAMVDAYYTGGLSLSEIKSVWSVGDERKVTLAAMAADGVSETHASQEVTFVILNFGDKTLSDDTECLAIVGQKDCLAEAGAMATVQYEYDAWDGCNRRRWCNQIYRNAIPESFRQLFKQAKNIAAGSAGSAVTSVDYFALASEKEVNGTVSMSFASAEADNKQFEYYEIASNRIKKQGSGSSGTTYHTRSIRSGGYWNYFTDIGPTGSVESVRATGDCGLAPFGCI